MTVTRGQTVDIGHGRGRLAPAAAASIWRLDADLGRPADVNSAWRDPVLQQQLYDAWVAYSRYLAGGPWAPKAPRALKPSESVHCDGEAADSDDWYNAAAAAKWRDHGWRQTARTSNATTDEPWHGEHFEKYDNHRNEAATTGSKPFEEDDMFTDADRALLSEVKTKLDAAFRNDYLPLMDQGRFGEIMSRLDQLQGAPHPTRNDYGRVMDAGDLQQLLNAIAALARPLAPEAATSIQEIADAVADEIDARARERLEQ